MSLEILIVVVVLQVLTFQFGVARLSRALPDSLIGTENLPTPVAEGVASFKQSVGRLRYPMGALLVVATIIVAYLLPLGPGGAKLSLATISVISAAACAIGYLHDRRKIAAIAADLPEPSVRTATLQRDSLRLHYSPVWESLPLLILLATVVATLWTWMGPEPAGTASRGDLVVLPIVQGVYVFACLTFTLWSVRSGSRLPQKSKAFLGTPERAVGIENALSQVELRFFMIAKIAVALMFGLMQLDQILVYTGRQVPLVLDLSPWILLVLLLGLYLTFMVKTSRVSKALTL